MIPIMYPKREELQGEAREFLHSRDKNILFRIFSDKHDTIGQSDTIETAGTIPPDARATGLYTGKGVISQEKPVFAAVSAFSAVSSKRPKTAENALK
ncbi:MAG: hypothetical protein ACLP9L_18370 [Thermoguttaceae bacterium]